MGVRLVKYDLYSSTEYQSVIFIKMTLPRWILIKSQYLEHEVFNRYLKQDLNYGLYLSLRPRHRVPNNLKEV